MNNYQVSIDLTKIKGAKVLDLKNKDGHHVRCVVLPIHECALKPHKEAIYLNLDAKALANNNYGTSHSLKQQFTKEVYSTFSQEERMSIPFLGNLKPKGKAYGLKEEKSSPTPQVSSFDDDYNF